MRCARPRTGPPRDEGDSLTQVVEAILDRYLKHGLTDAIRRPGPPAAPRSR